MRALQSALFKRMIAAGIRVNDHVLTGSPIAFEGKIYHIRKVPRAN